MKWSSDGKKICIVYQDGAVIVGSVDGTRVWCDRPRGCRGARPQCAAVAARRGKDSDKPDTVELHRVEWSPTCRYIIFGTRDGEVHLHDHNGNFMARPTVAAVPRAEFGRVFCRQSCPSSRQSRVMAPRLSVWNGALTAALAERRGHERRRAGTPGRWRRRLRPRWLSASTTDASSSWPASRTTVRRRSRRSRDCRRPVADWAARAPRDPQSRR
jgi:hypothetical protein